MPAHWQERAREVEDRLSDALHERLTQRFVDRRTSALMRSLRDRGEHAAVVDTSGEIAVDGHLVGRIDGLNLTIVEADLDADRRLLAAAARRAALPALRRKVAELVARRGSRVHPRCSRRDLLAGCGRGTAAGRW